jgi:hypothetical protein
VVAVCVIFVFFVLMQVGNQRNESLTKSRYSHILFDYLFVFVDPIERYSLENFGSPWRAVATDFQTFRKKETNKKFDDVRWVLTGTRVAPECWDTTRPTHPCRGTI